MNFFIELALQWVAYLVVAGIVGFALNWASNGFLFPSLSVKLSRGKKTLVVVHSINGQYYKTGIISKGFLLYKDNEKNQHRINVDDKDSVGYTGGSRSIHVDEESDTIIKPNFKVGNGFDAVKYENLYVRALMSPQAQDSTTKIIMIAAVIAAIASIVCLYLIYVQGTEIGQIKQIVEVVRTL